jgi:hypothetical protein
MAAQHEAARETRRKMLRWFLALCVLLILALATPALALTVAERAALCAARSGAWWQPSWSVGFCFGVRPW